MPDPAADVKRHTAPGGGWVFRERRPRMCRGDTDLYAYTLICFGGLFLPKRPRSRSVVQRMTTEVTNAPLREERTVPCF